MVKGIKNIIFDLGGVLININYKLTEQAFVQAGIANFGQIYSQLKQTTLFDDFEKGTIEPTHFINALQAQSAAPISDAQIINAWNAMLLDFPLRRLQILQQLRLHYNLFLLSNTNSIHEEAFNKILMQDHGIPSLGVFFDRVYLSHRLGLRKPMPQIFTKVLTDNGLQAHETLFIDDSIQHIQGANTVGIQTIHVAPGMSIEQDIFKPLR
jgi:putative hydrolase of the HAD superfamily